MRTIIVAVVLVAARVAAAGRGAAILIPPAEVDVGVGTPLGGEATSGPSSEVLAGIHWASLYGKPTPIDIGVGFVGSSRAVAPQFAIARVVPGSFVITPITNRLTLDGAYIDLAYAIANHRHYRTWAAMRIETLRGNVNGQSFDALGAALRVASEVYTSGALFAAGRRSLVALSGALALGVYVEGSHRNIPAELGPDEVTAGITMRVPFFAAIVN